MKPIELTDIQKDKLLEMARESFPEYDFEFKLKNNILSLGKKHLDLYTNTIHWFEFCMTYLKNKILDVVDYSEIEKFLMRCLFQCEMPHPVDYLYEQFKKLK